MENLHNISFKEFKKLFGKQASYMMQKTKNMKLLRRELGMYYSRDSFLRQEHAKLILQAIEENQEISRPVLEEYQDYPLLETPIKKYCKKRGWHLKPKEPAREVSKPTLKRFYVPRDLYR